MKTLITLLSLSTLFLFTSCSKDADTNSSASSEKVVAEYSGVLVGSTGAYKLSLKDNEVVCSLTFDGTNYTLSSDKGLEKGSSVTLQNNDISITVATDNSGNTPTLNFNIPGHTINYTILKSSTTNPARNYLGTFTATEDNKVMLRATFNMTLGTNNDFNIIVKTTYVDPDPNSSYSDDIVGEVQTVNGTITETANQVNFAYDLDGQNETMVMTKSGNNLIYTDNHGGVATAVLVP